VWHNALSWKVEITTKQEVMQKRVPDYAKANIEAIAGLQEVDWHNLFNKSLVDDSWMAFKSKLEAIVYPNEESGR